MSNRFVALDENGKVVLAEDGEESLVEVDEVPNESQIPSAVEAEQQARRIAFATFLEVVVKGGDVESIGKRAMTLAHVFRVREYRTQRELAERLGVSQARVSQLLRKMLRQISQLTRIQ